MVGPPLLPLLFYSIFGYGNTVESQTTNHRFGESRTNIHRVYTGNIFQSLYQITGKMPVQIIFLKQLECQGSLFLLSMSVRSSHHHFG